MFSLSCGLWGAEQVLFEHGGNLEKAACKYGYPIDAFTDFSVNINPLGRPPALIQVLQQGLSKIGRYPDPGYQRGADELGRYLGVPAESVLLCNGGMEAIDLVARAFQPQVGIVLEPTFVEYRRMAVNAGMQVVKVYRQPVAGQNDLGEQIEKACQTGSLAPVSRSRKVLVFVCNPNNPTGDIMDISFLRRLAGDSRLLAVDEAFMDFVGETDLSLRSAASRSQHTVVMGSLTKILHIPGLRLGYIVAHPLSIAKLKKIQVPWSVNALAQSVAENINKLGLDEFLAQTRETVAMERKFLCTELAKHNWLKVFPSVVNYLLVRVRPDQAPGEDLVCYLGNRGILVRDCSNFTGLDQGYFRIGIKSRKENDQLVEAISGFSRERYPCS